MSKKALIGFVGLGNMGHFMAKNLINKGHELIVYDMNPRAVKELLTLGAKSSDSPADLASRTKNIITMLPSHPHVNEVFTSKNGILSTVQKDSVCMDCSTIDIEVSKRIARLCKEKNVKFNDAPVSGGVKGAENATLTFMVGSGSKDNFAQIKPILECMGKNIVHCGDNGTGLAAKICNNMLLGISMLGVSETMNLGIQLGLDKHTLANILNSSSGRCWSSDTYNPVPDITPGVPSCNDYKGGFQCGLMTKDLSLAQNSAIESQSATPLGSAAYNFFKHVSNQGFADKDMGYVYEYLRNKKK
jgi:3-hydroxyisobutyrate dehydrogenase